MMCSISLPAIFIVGVVAGVLTSGVNVLITTMDWWEDW